MDYIKSDHRIKLIHTKLSVNDEKLIPIKLSVNDKILHTLFVIDS